jgi:hypothetical protein
MLVAVVAATGVAGISGSATAGKAGTDVVVTKATGDTEHVQVRGKVSSDLASCSHGRKVSVWHDVDPGGRSPDDFKLGTTKSDDNGKWELATVALPDKVYARAKKNRHCGAAISPTVVVRFR